MRSILIVVLGCLIGGLVGQTPARGQNPPLLKIEYGPTIRSKGNSAIAPIRVKISRNNGIPLNRDQRFHVLIHDRWQNGRRSQKFSCYLTILAGKVSGQIEFPVRIPPGGDARILIENGNGNGRLSKDDLVSANVPFSSDPTNPSYSTTWLLIDDAAPPPPMTSEAVPVSGVGESNFFNGWSQTNLPASVPVGQFKNSIDGMTKLFNESHQVLLQQSAWNVLPPAELPKNWVGLSGVDYVLISMKQLESFVKLPDKRQLLENWVVAGGRLVVYNPGNSLDHAGKIFPALVGGDRDMEPIQWTVQPEDLAKPGRSLRLDDSFAKADPTKPTGQLSKDDILVSKSYVKGQVIAVVKPDMVPKYITLDSFPGVIRSQPGPHSGRSQAVPGVGKPPVKLFAVLTAGFLFAIGPLILTMVAINNRRRYLFFAVPLISGITCACILGYAVVADFGKQWAAIETVMVVDQKTGLAYCETVSAYYCGSQPPYYDYDPDTKFQLAIDNANGYEVLRLADKSQLSSPKIQARRSHEILVGKPVATEQRLLVSPSPGDPKAVQVKNLLGSQIQTACIQFNDKFYVIDDLDHQQTTTAKPISREQGRVELLDAIDKGHARGGTSFFRSWQGRQSFVTRFGQRDEYTAIVRSNATTQSLTEPFEIKHQLNIVHGRF